MKINCKLKVSTSNLNSIFICSKIFKKRVANFRVIVLPKKKKRFTLLKSPHVNKKSKEHFQLLSHQRLYYITFASVFLLKETLLLLPNDLNTKLNILS
jgi:small subunit ribosomal protein S10